MSWKRWSASGPCSPDQEIVSAAAVEMPILCSLMDVNCNTADYSTGLDDAGNEVVLAGWQITPWNYGDGQADHVAIGTDAQNLGNVSGEWHADITICAKRNVGDPYCNEGTCTDGSCYTEETPTGVGCGCNGTDTCNQNVYFSWPPIVACVPESGLWGCAVDTDCTIVHGLGEGYYCKDAGRSGIRTSVPARSVRAETRSAGI